MNEGAIDHAQRAFRKALRALQRLKETANWEEQVDAWGRVYSKLLEGAEKVGDEGAWRNEIMEERKSDELLCYMHHARNADFHRYEEIANTLTGGFVTLHYHDGRVEHHQVDFLSDKKPSIVIDYAEVASIAQGSNPLYLRVMPVKGRGVRYLTPTVHLGKPVQANPSIHQIGELMLAYLSAMLIAASHWPTSPAPRPELVNG